MHLWTFSAVYHPGVRRCRRGGGWKQQSISHRRPSIWNRESHCEADGNEGSTSSHLHPPAEPPPPKDATVASLAASSSQLLALIIPRPAQGSDSAAPRYPPSHRTKEDPTLGLRRQRRHFSPSTKAAARKKLPLFPASTSPSQGTSGAEQMYFLVTFLRWICVGRWGERCSLNDLVYVRML